MSKQERIEAQLELARHLQEVMNYMSCKQIEQVRRERTDPRGQWFCKGSAVGFAMAENACRCFIRAAQAEQAGHGKVVWTKTGFKLQKGEYD